jgi:hypothetical protein
MSRRSFERKFFQKVGLSSKYYARLRRIGYVMNVIAGKKKVDWSSIFHECEFYDQAHFIKDFEEFTGRTPQQYLKENLELANLGKSPGRGFFSGVINGIIILSGGRHFKRPCFTNRHNLLSSILNSLHNAQTLNFTIFPESATIFHNE